MIRDAKLISKNMKKIRSKDTSIEVRMRKAMWHKGYRYRKNYNKLPGKPDLVLTKYKIAVFCDSEFFHGKDWEILKARLETGNNPEYWMFEFFFKIGVRCGETIGLTWQNVDDKRMRDEIEKFDEKRNRDSRAC